MSSQIKVEFSMKFTSRDMSLKRTPSKKQTGVFGVKISVVTKCVRGWGWLLPPCPCGLWGLGTRGTSPIPSTLHADPAPSQGWRGPKNHR